MARLTLIVGLPRNLSVLVLQFFDICDKCRKSGLEAPLMGGMGGSFYYWIECIYI